MPYIDGVTERVLIAGIPSRSRLEALLDLALLRRHAGARRVLERVLGESLKVQSDVLQDGSWGHDHNDLSAGEPRRRRGGEPLARTDVVYARLRLSADVVWENGTLFAVVPDTLRAAVNGRPLGDVVRHPALDADAIATSVERGSRHPPRLLRIVPTRRAVEPARGVARIARTRERLAILIRDSTLHDTPRWAMAVYGGLGALVILAQVLKWDVENVLTHTIGVFGAIYLGFGFLNACTGRTRSWIGLVTAESRHQDALRAARLGTDHGTQRTGEGEKGPP